MGSFNKFFRMTNKFLNETPCHTMITQVFTSFQHIIIVANITCWPSIMDNWSVEHDDNACLHESHDPFMYDPGGARMYCTLLKEK